MSETQKRSKIRLKAGKIFYSSKRHLTWLVEKNNYANRQSIDLLDYEIFHHKTPIYRHLSKLDMWMQENKHTNLSIALTHINGLIIAPGEIFSFWKRIGKPTRKKGYKKGMVLEQGVVKPGTGGGLCQLSNMLFWMVLHTPLSVIERHRHSFDVFPDNQRTLPFGSGATVAYNYIDFQFLNNTKQNFQLSFHIEDDFLYGKILADEKPMYTYNVIEKNHYFKNGRFGHYLRHNELYRKKTSATDNNVSNVDFIAENNALVLYTPFIESKKDHKN